MDLEEQYDRLLRYCYMKLRDRTLAEDVTQETFTRFFESASYRRMGKELPYLYTIARNLCADRFRRREDCLLGDLLTETDEVPATADETQKTVERLAIEHALDKLDAEEREAVVLRFSVGMGVADVGKTLGLSRFAVRRRLSAALTKLREEMEETV